MVWNAGRIDRISLWIVAFDVYSSFDNWLATHGSSAFNNRKDKKILLAAKEYSIYAPNFCSTKRFKLSWSFIFPNNSTPVPVFFEITTWYGVHNSWACFKSFRIVLFETLSLLAIWSTVNGSLCSNNSCNIL